MLRRFGLFGIAVLILLLATTGVLAGEQTLSINGNDQNAVWFVSGEASLILNGFDLTRQIKSRFGFPVILVTGREREEHRLEGLEAGADAYVVKSTFEDRGLLEIVEQFV